jgi:hypothetical protein
MKGRKEHEEHRKHRETGGVNEAERDIKEKPHMRVSAPEIEREADELKRGGRAKRKRGGHVMHHEGMGPEHEGTMHHMRRKRKDGGHVGKEVGQVMGEHAKHHAGRKPRKSGGRATSDENPFTSARSGTPAPGRKLEAETMD